MQGESALAAHGGNGQRPAIRDQRSEIGGIGSGARFAGGGFAGDPFDSPACAGTLRAGEFVGHGEEVVEQVGGEVFEADENAVVSEVVVGGVVEVGRLGEEGGAVLAVDADEDRVGLGGFVGGDAGHQVAADLEGRGPEGGGFFYVGEG